MIRLCAVALIALVFGASDPPIPPVRLHAVVTDSAGRPILDLRPGDFELRENGIVRPIEAVELRAVSRQPPAETPATAPGADQEQAAGARGTRVFAILLDEYHVGPGQPTERVRASLTRFVTEQMRPGDLAAVVKPLDRVTSIHFTGDRDGLRAAIASFAGRKGDFAPRSTFEEQYIGHAPEAVEAARRQIVSSALREMAMRLGEVSADRAVIVLVSEGFPRTPPANLRQVRIPDLQALVRAASRFHLAVYGFNPSDAPPEGDDDRSALEWLSVQTGGRISTEGAALDAGLQRMAADLDAYYVLTYQPARTDGRFHPLQVIAKRKDAIVRTRPGYWAALGSELRAEAEGTSAPATTRRALRRSPIIAAWAGVSRAADGRMRVTVTWDAAAVAPRAASPRVPPGAVPAPAAGSSPTSASMPAVAARQARAVKLKAQTTSGEILFEGSIGPAGSAAQMPDAAAFDAPPGRVELDMEVLDVGGAVLDTDARDVEVPNLAAQKKGPTILTPEIIRARTAPEFRALAGRADAAPSPSRAFTRGDRLLIRVEAWDPAGKPVEVTATVTNAIGGAMRAIDRNRDASGRSTFDLPLAWLAPGDYAIALAAKGESGEAKDSVRFTVR